MEGKKSVKAVSSWHSDDTLTSPFTVLLRAGSAVSAKLDMLIDQVDLFYFGPLFPGRSENFIYCRINDTAFAVAANDGRYPDMITHRPSSFHPLIIRPICLALLFPILLLFLTGRNTIRQRLNIPLRTGNSLMKCGRM